MMRQMRQNTKIIMLVTALAFVALMVFEWGMDMSGQTAGGDLGRVGSTTVTPQMYQQVQSNIRDQVQRAQEDPISPAQQREIDDLAWNQVVNQILIQMELENRGIRVTDDEIRQAARFSPLPEFREDPQFQDEDGRFDFQLYEQFIAQQMQMNPMLRQELVRYYQETIPREKLLRQVTAGIYVSDRELWRDFRDRNERVDVQFIALSPQNLVADDDVTVTDDEIQQYYRQNEESFRVPASADVRYTYLDQAPTAADSIASREVAESIRQEILDGAPFAELAQLESVDRTSAQQGGEMEPFSEGEQDPAIEEVAFTIPIGELSEPIRGEQGYHIIEVLSREDGQVRARQILIPFERSTDSEIELLTMADSLEALGRNLTVQQAAAEMDLPVMEGEITEDFAVLAGVGVAVEGEEWVFEDREGVGAVSPVFETEDAFYMLEILSESPARTLSLDEVRDEIRETLRSSKKAERTLEIARGYVSEIRDGSVTLEELAEREGFSLNQTGMFSRMENVSGLGQANAAVGAAFGSSVGEIAGPVRRGDQVLVMQVLDREEASREAWEAQKDLQRAQLTAQMRQQRLQLWLEGLRETVRIVDARSEFYRQVEEASDGPQIPMFF
ncbi:MAG: hypothetical protein EA351_11760 [Gemmatimonadales bacterium]|nr:MAG: hypothetical protein EA351_11760 [Gemmatimonadales bacterium]